MALVLTCAMEALQQAEAALSRDWKSFCAKKGALRKPRARGDYREARPDENAITYEIGDYVHRHMKALPVDHPYRGFVQFVYERPQGSARLAGSHRKRQDLRFEAYVPNGPEFVIEAKPLFQDSDVKARYLGDEGLGRFTRQDEPLTYDELAALLGYVRAADAKRWSEAVRCAVAGHADCEEVVDIDVQPWGYTYSSRHRRQGSSAPVWILHLQLKYPPPAGMTT